MKEIKDIYKEVYDDCIKNNCQSTQMIAMIAMEKAITEYKQEMLDKLNNLSNNYEVSHGLYYIQKHTLDNFIEEIENDEHNY